MCHKTILAIVIGMVIFSQTDVLSFGNVAERDAANGEAIKPAPSQPPPAKETVDTAKIQSLIAELNNDDIAVRDRATEDLRKIGKAAMPYLIKAAKSDTPEVAWRAKIIIRSIEKDEQKKPAEPPDPVYLSPSRKPGQSIPNITVHISPGVKSYSYAKDATGKITVTITEYDKDGKQETKTYTADSEDEFKQKYPEIAKEYGIGEQYTFKFDIPGIDMDDIWKDFGNSMDSQMNNMRKEMERLRKMFDERSQIPPQKEPEDEDVIPPQMPALTATTLGVTIEDAEKGVVVMDVHKDSIAEKMGLKSGDIITGINDSQVTSAWECRRLVKEALASGRIKLDIIREGKKLAKNYPQ